MSACVRPLLRCLLRAKDCGQRHKSATFRRSGACRRRPADARRCSRTDSRTAEEYHSSTGDWRSPKYSRRGLRCRLGQSAWERIKLQEQEFFGPRNPEIATAANAAARTRLIEALNTANASPADKRLYRDFIMSKRGAEGTSLFAHDSERSRSPASAMSISTPCLPKPLPNLPVCGAQAPSRPAPILLGAPA